MQIDYLYCILVHSNIFCLGMDNENILNATQEPKGRRRKWEAFEEEVLLGVLEDFVARKQRCDTGAFKQGTLVEIAKAVNVLCPHSNIKANPHIESKLKKWKKTYSMVVDMINTSGFAWNDVKKCVEVDSDDAWQTYVQVHILFYLCISYILAAIFVTHAKF